MKNNDSIITYIDYGHIKYDIRPVMKKRNLSRNQIANRTGLHYQVIERYMNDSVTRFDREVLAKLCYVLDCTLDEILVYVKPKGK